VNFLELFYDNLPQKNLDKRSSLFLSELQSVSRDFAFFIDDFISAEELIKAIKSLKIDVLSEVNIFDVYKDTKLDNNKKSIAFNIKLQPKTQTLIEAEIDNISNQIIRVIKEKLKGELRDK
jgi:phenylalanyl-tRNA synthetase beta chain